VYGEKLSYAKKGVQKFLPSKIVIRYHAFDEVYVAILGRSYCVTSQRVMIQCLESLVQKVHAGVVIHLEKIGPDPPPIDGRDDNDQGEMDKIDDEVGIHNCHT